MRKKNISLSGFSALVLATMFPMPKYRPATLVEEDYPPAESVPTRKKMELTEEEVEKLSRLSGKEKKQFLKELKRKYNA